MTYIKTGVQQAGIVELLFYKGASGKALSYLANTLLNGPSPLSRAERELIAFNVSKANDCTFCASSHGAVADALIGDNGLTRKSLLENKQSELISPLMNVLLEIASQVQKGGKFVEPDSIVKAKKLGASDEAIHDTILIASAFCMYNRYVDGLNTGLPKHEKDYEEGAKRIVKKGYAYPPLFLRKWIVRLLNKKSNL
jgi:uncharacterized peroxidase-related enzyme